jgi:TolB-like protein/Flp pilus assembly protein TadD
LGVPDIFLSYNREDQTRAKVFAEAFEAQGFKVWWDVGLKAGEAYDEVTETALRTAKAVVVLWSKKSVASRWVRAEATLADRNKTLVPCMIEPCERPIMFELTQTAELGHWSGDAGDRAWVAFLADVKRFVGRDAPAPAKVATAAAPPPQAPEASTRPSLAVLPFTNRSGLKEDDIFAIGMVEDVIDALSMSRGLRVLASGSTAAYRRNSADVAGIGAALGVRYLMEGNIRRVGDTLRVTAQLIEAASGAILWTQKFDRPLAELAMLQEELVTEVATHLGSQIVRVEIEKALRKPGNITSYEARIRSAMAATRGDWVTAIAEAERAVAQAPDDGCAHACLAFAFSGEICLGSDDPKWWPLVQTHIAKALSLDPGRPYVQLWVGWAYAWSGRPSEGLPYIESAVALNRSNVNARHARATVYAMLGRLDEALEDALAVEALSPHSPSLYNLLGARGLLHLQAGRLEQARADLDRSLRLMPNFVSALIFRACLATLQGDASGARAAVSVLRTSHAHMDRRRSLSHLQRNSLPDGPMTATMLTALAKAWDETPA